MRIREQTDESEKGYEPAKWKMYAAYVIWVESAFIIEQIQKNPFCRYRTRYR